MASDFTPFLSTIKTRLAATPAKTSAGSDFEPATTGARAAQPCGEVPRENQAHREVKVEVERVGDRVSLIRIQCRCGELIELDCEY